jgi:uncharacterized Zn-finger protein
MTDYICSKCNEEFSNKSLYDRHINRKTSCITHYIKLSNEKYACKYCNMEYTRSNSVNNHIETCIEKVKQDKDSHIEQLNIDITNLEEKNRFLVAKIERLQIELNSFKKKKKILTQQSLIETLKPVQSITPF